MHIFGWVSDWLGLVTAPKRELRRQEEIIDLGPLLVDDIWPEANVCWGILVGVGVGSVYLVGIGVS